LEQFYANPKIILNISNLLVNIIIKYPFENKEELQKILIIKYIKRSLLFLLSITINPALPRYYDFLYKIYSHHLNLYKYYSEFTSEVIRNSFSVFGAPDASLAEQYIGLFKISTNDVHTNIEQINVSLISIYYDLMNCRSTQSWNLICD
jgi:hypothetical protein